MDLKTFRKIYTTDGAPEKLRFEVRDDFEATYDHVVKYGLHAGVSTKLPRTLADLRAHPLVEEVSDERAQGDGIWVYLESGLIREECDQVHCVHEDTVRECCEAFRWIHVGCDCDQCQDELAAKRAPDPEPEDPTEVTCPACNTEAAPVVLGNLGKLTWCRCRACGHTHPVNAPEARS